MIPTRGARSALPVLLALALAPVASTAPAPARAAVQSESGAPEADPVIAAAGDIACDPGNVNYNNGNGTLENCRQRAVSDLLMDDGLAAVLPLGDVQYQCGGYQAFLQSYDPSWGRVKGITHPVVGNHEYLTAGGTDCNAANTGAAGYFRYFGAAAGQQGQGWYSYDVGAWHVIALNSNCGDAGGCGPGSAQYEWLKADLAAHGNACTLAYWHIPLFSSGGRAANNSTEFWRLLYNADADLILTGHDHIYERFAPQTPTGVLDPARGIRQFIVGTGGSNYTSITSIAANSEVREANTFGVLKLTLRPTSYDWAFVPEAGKTFTDLGTGQCHAPPTPVFADTFESGSLSTWTGVSGLAVGQQEAHAGFWGARATSTSGTVAWAWKQLPSAHADLSTRQWFKVVGLGSNVVDLIKLRTGSGTALLTVFASPTGVLGYQNNVTARSTYSSAAVSRGVWHSLEVRAVVAGAASRTETWLDGQPVAALTRTEDLGTVPVGRLQLGENISGRTYDVAFDDVSLFGPPDATPPTPPTNLAATGSTSTTVSLSWSPSTDNIGVSGYEISVNTAPRTTVSGTSVTVAALRCATTYTFDVLALDAAGNRSPPSTVTAATNTCPPISVFADTFESGSLSTWTGVSGLAVGQQEAHAGFWGARATSTSGTVAWAWKQLPSAHADLSTRLWFKVVGLGSNVVDLIKLRTGSGTALLTVFASPTGVLGYQNNVTARSTYSSTGVSRGVWHSLEVRAVVAGAASRTETWLDGQPVADLTRTEDLGTVPVGRLQLGENISGRTYDVAFDDVSVTAPAPS